MPAACPSSLRSDNDRFYPHHPRDLWRMPDLWTRKRPRAHQVLGRRQTDAGAHNPPQAAPTTISTEHEKEETAFIKSADDALGLNLWTALRSATGGRRPQVSVGGTIRPIA